GGAEPARLRRQRLPDARRRQPRARDHGAGRPAGSPPEGEAGVSDKLSSPRDLFLHLLAEMLWVERMLVFEVLPNLLKQVQSESLAAAVEEHLAQTRGHVTRA